MTDHHVDGAACLANMDFREEVKPYE